MATRQVPTEQEVLGYMDSLSNWGRWGTDDELGTLNLITPQKRAQAGSLVREGISVTCARLIVPEIAADVTSIPPLHYMMSTGESAPSTGPHSTGDFIGLSFHGLTITHLDSICHQVWGREAVQREAGLSCECPGKGHIRGHPPDAGRSRDPWSPPGHNPGSR